MKKLLTIGLALTLALATVGCGNKEVTLELPATYVGVATVAELADDLDIEDTTKITVNPDGSATVILTEEQRKAEREELNEEFTEEIVDLYSGDSEDKVPSFVNIEFDQTYTKFDVYVDTTQFSEIEKMYSMLFMISGQVIQSFDGIAEENIDVQVNYYDNATKENFYTITLKEVIAAANEQ